MLILPASPFFGMLVDMDKDDTLIKVTVRLPADMVERLKIRSAKEREPLQSLIGTAIRQFLKTPLRREGGSQR